MDRTKGIGGSDQHHLFNLKPYGCRRKLWYEKQGIEADFPFLGNKLTDRGNRLEPVIADIYIEKTKRGIVEISPPQDTHREYAYITAHYDRIIRKFDGVRRYEAEDAGILEIKSVGKEIYYQVKADGVPYSWILQLQHYLMISEYTWGALAIWWADGNEFIDFEVQADKELQGMILKAAIEFWTMVQEGKEEPELLDPSDKRCKTCPYRTKCQGQALIDSVDKSDDSEVEIDTTMDGLIEEYNTVNSEYKEIEESLKEVKANIALKMGRRALVQTSNAKIHYKAQETRRWDGTMLEDDHPELVEKYKKKTVSRPLRIYIKKK